MIATIVIGILLALLLIIVVILSREGNYDDGAVYCILVSIILIVVLVISLSLGIGITKQDTTKYLIEKEQIEYTLENKLSLYSIEQAKKYNHKIQVGNNYWCRFTIEDRSEYLIDIERYISWEE